ncbi:putative UvrD/REP helicase [Treponema primitia ZAS-2]|uniref:Putative UvrD/REP helicase n=1 Tax=Treponema primitia (strain ATCC BAA-887 / DSM 12427 / ZAS-2) TaxID=545694 RepID=F5YJU6_TREPZ|nr:UvrD/REP helicase [Treponema primitia]AEF84849.1 putative UvrD/REP helicase [Treponema primitia ZAS-2]
MTNLVLSSSFFTSFMELPKHAQDKVRDFFEKFCKNPNLPGIRFKSINKHNGKQLYSVRINDNYRGIICKDENDSIIHLLCVDKHDDAYEWADSKKQLNGEPATILFYGKDYYKENGITLKQGTKLFARISNKDLLYLGVPQQHLSLIRGISDINTFQTFKDLLPENVYANLEWLAYGYHINDLRENDKKIRLKLFDFINIQVLQPCLVHPDLDEDKKESIRDTIRMLQNKKTVKEIVDFIDDALDRKRGKEMHSALKACGLTTFEDIESDIREMAYNTI